MFIYNHFLLLKLGKKKYKRKKTLPFKIQSCFQNQFFFIFLFKKEIGFVDLDEEIIYQNDDDTENNNVAQSKKRRFND